MSGLIGRVVPVTGLFMLFTSGCLLLLGVEEERDRPPAEDPESALCVATASEKCYTGPLGTQDVGGCRSGERTCSADGQAWSACEDEVHPEEERCAAVEDENCDGFDCGIWGRIFENDGATVRSVAVDPRGDIVVGGEFSTVVQVGGGPQDGVEDDIFIAKFDRDGNHVWSKTFSAPDKQILGGISIDGEGKIAVVGINYSLSGAPLNFGGEDLGKGLFVAKLDGFGAHVWSRSGTGGFTDYSDSGPAIAVDPAGNVIVGGTFASSIDFGDGALEADNQMGVQVFVAKLLSANGSTVAADGGWARAFGGSSIDKLNAVAVDAAGSIVVAGQAFGNDGIHFGSLPSLDTPTTYVVKINSSGYPLWSDGFASCIVTALGVDTSGNCTMVGRYSDSVSFGGDDLPKTSHGVFVAQLDAQGAHRWSHGLVSSMSISANGVAIDSAGAAIVTGDFKVDANLGGGAVIAESNVYVTKFDAEGTYLWSRGFGERGPKVGAAVATNPEQQIIIAGQSHGVIDFGTGPLVSREGIFLAKIGL